MSNLFEDIFSVGLEDESETSQRPSEDEQASPTTEESTPVAATANTGKTDLNAVGQAQQEQSETEQETATSTDVTDTDTTDS